MGGNTQEATAPPAPRQPRYLVPQEEVLDGARALLPEDHQPPAVPDEEPTAVAWVLLDGLHWPQRLPAAVVIGDTAGRHTDRGVRGGLGVAGTGRGAGGAHLCRISSGKRVLSSSSTRVGRERKYTAPPSVPRQATVPADVGRTTVTRVMPGEQLEGGSGGLRQPHAGSEGAPERAQTSPALTLYPHRTRRTGTASALTAIRAINHP